MSREFKHYQMRATRRPAKSEALSTTVVVVNEQGERGYCYVSFSDSLVASVGKRLPRGVSAHDPAYLIVTHSEDGWRVMAAYASGGDPVTLWWTGTKPSWLNFYKLKVKE